MKSIILILLGFFVLNVASAQAPGKIPYQGVARDAQGNALQNQLITLRLTIEDAAGADLFQEIHQTTTNQFGLFTVQVGSIVPMNIDWGAGTRFLHVEMDPQGGSSYTDLGTTQFLSVPYALYAESSNTPGPQGPVGNDGVGISSVIIENNQLIITYSDGTISNAGNIGAADTTIANRVASLEETIFVPPSITVPTISDITYTNANFTAEIADMGSCQRFFTKGFVASLFTNLPTVTANPELVFSSGTVASGFQIEGNYVNNEVGQFSHDGWDWFTPGKCYFVRAFVQDDYGRYFYSAPVTFTTQATTEQIGPGGGLIVYDKGEYTDGWRYLEYNYSAVSQNGWGCETIATGVFTNDLGGGDINQSQILNACNDPNSAASFCSQISLNGFDDWYLPNSYEMAYVIMSYSLPVNRYYWVSQEDPASSSRAGVLSGVNFSSPEFQDKSNQNYFVPVRKF